MSVSLLMCTHTAGNNPSETYLFIHQYVKYCSKALLKISVDRNMIDRKVLFKQVWF